MAGMTGPAAGRPEALGGGLRERARMCRVLRRPGIANSKALMEPQEIQDDGRRYLASDDDVSMSLEEIREEERLYPDIPEDGIRMRIDGEWYDCTGWAKAHPGGSRWLTWFDGRDATDVFYAFHSYGPQGDDLAARRLAKLPRVVGPDKPAMFLPEDKGVYSALSSFRELRKKMERDGWFARDPVKEAWSLFQVVALYASGTFLAWSHPVWAGVLIGLGMCQAGWLGHDYIHGRGKWCSMMRRMPTLLNGHSTEWWTQKHSLHHSFTNEEQLDGDIVIEPFYYLRHPKESGRADHPLRKWQHIYGYPLLGVVFWLWRFHSLVHPREGILKRWREDPLEAALMAANYAYLAWLPWQVAIASVTLGGFLVGAIVSATHQSEEIMPSERCEFVEGQFRSTRDAECVLGPLEQWLWGGMETQLEHHLFPTLPRYRHHQLRPILKEWADNNGMTYRCSSTLGIIKQNWSTLRDIAVAAP